jgi:transcriptional regulator with XRE-family HTH domain
MDKKILESKEMLSKSLAKARSKSQITLSDLSAQTELGQNTIKKIEKGEANPTLKEIIKLATALELPAHELLSTKKIGTNKSKD